jgi:hypothetical protein
MSLISYVKKEEATGPIAEIYEMLEQRIQVIPNVVQFYTASPELFGKFMNLIGHYIDHPTLDTATVAYIRMLISHKEDATYCVLLQSGILRSLEIPDQDLELAREDYTRVNLPEKSRALVCFVLDQMFDKLTDTRARINELKELGWSEKDIFEASVMGAIQKGMVNVIKSFEVELDFKP